jgi:hypothetical protein
MAANPTPTDADPETHDTTNGSSRAEATRPITIGLPDDLLRKLKIIAIVRDTSVSELVAEAAAGVVRRELKRALAKISGE